MIKRSLRQAYRHYQDQLQKSKAQNHPIPKHPQALWQRLNDLGFFYSRWHANHAPWQPTKSQWQWFYWAINQSQMHLFLGARGIGKSDLLTIFRPLYLIIQNPSISILILTGTRSRSQEIISLIARMLLALGIPLADHKSNQIRTQAGMLNKSPTLYSASISSRIRGDHPDLIIIEDPLDEREGYSSAKKDQVMKSILEARRMANDQVSLIGQFVAEDDPFAQIAQEASSAILTAWASQVPDLIRNRPDASLLANNPMLAYSWAINMEGYFPSRDAALFAQIPLTHDLPTHEIIAILDPAFGGSDASALAIGGLYQHPLSHQQCIIAWVWSFEGAWYQHVNQMASLIHDLKADHLYYEGKRFREIGQEFQKHQIASSAFDSYLPKRYKIEHASSYVGLGRVFLHNSLHPKEINNIRQWHPKLRHDDAVDALAMLIYRLFRLDHQPKRFW